MYFFKLAQKIKKEELRKINIAPEMSTVKGLYNSYDDPNSIYHRDGTARELRAYPTDGRRTRYEAGGSEDLEDQQWNWDTTHGERIKDFGTGGSIIGMGAGLAAQANNPELVKKVNDAVPLAGTFGPSAAGAALGYYAGTGLAKLLSPPRPDLGNFRENIGYKLEPRY